MHELHHLLTAIRDDSDVAPHGATFEDGYRCAEVCDAILRSAEGGSREEVSYRDWERAEPAPLLRTPPGPPPAPSGRSGRSGASRGRTRSPRDESVYQDVVEAPAAAVLWETPARPTLAVAVEGSKGIDPAPLAQAVHERALGAIPALAAFGPRRPALSRARR